MIPTRAKAWALTLSSTLALSLSGCNVFSSLDSPDGDVQLLSAARACFDKGDIACALEHYSKVSSGSSSEVAAAERAFAVLDQNGIGMGKFMTTMASGDLSAGLTSLAGDFSRNSGQSLRQSLYTAYREVDNIPTQSELRGLVRFITAYALSAAILAEEAGGDGTLSKTDIANSPNTCAPNCTKTSPVIVYGTGVNLISNPSPNGAMTGTSPTWGMLKGAYLAIVHALANELVAAGDFKTGTQDIAAAFNALDSNNSSLSEPAFRTLLLSQGVGQ